MLINRKKLLKGLVLLIFFSLIFSPLKKTEGSSLDDLRKKIYERNQNIKNIEEEIEGYKEQIEATGQKADTLKNSINKIDTTINKLGADIRVTENKVDATNFSIQKLNIEIGDKDEKIEQGKNSIKEIVRKMNEIESSSFVEMVLSQKDISDFWVELNEFQNLQTSVDKKIGEFFSIKEQLKINKTEVEGEKTKLLGLKTDLSDQKKIANNSRQEKDNLLEKTKNEEDTYKKMMAEKETLKRQFESELSDFESQLKIAIDPNSLPSAGSGVLRWPMSNLSLLACSKAPRGSNCITQFFGDTAFSRSGAYNGKGHNGVDFRASIGTKILASLSGTVQATGNTDAIKGCYSYGKWILIRHNNGLSTLYAHLNLIKVNPGETVKTGEIIGYSGNSGYSTGPHLHYTTYASEGVQVVRLGDIKQITNCGDAYLPVAPFSAYLNPLDYL